MFRWESIARWIPTVSSPLQKLSFREKGKWTLIILVLFFVLGSLTVWGINRDAVAQFEFLEIVFGSKFGSLITLGIGPIVTASIILQLLVGSKIINWDLNDEEQKKKFSAAQKILTLVFCLVEGIAYVLAGAVPPAAPDVTLIIIVIIQLTIGGIIIMFMDEVCSKWGFGSGVSLFIAAGVAKTILVRTLNPLTQAGAFPSPGEYPVGVIPLLITSFIEGIPAFLNVLPLVATIIVFFIVVFVQDVRIEIPMAFSLPFGKFASRRWPLKFLYTSNIPVILTAAVVANLQVIGRLLSDRGITFLGVYDTQGNPAIGSFMYFISRPSGEVGIMIVTILGSIVALLFAVMALRIWKKHALRMCVIGAIVGIIIGYIIVLTPTFNLPAITLSSVMHVLTYIGVYILGSVIFSFFWTATAGMDAKSVAEQFKDSFIMIPGFRHDPRIIEKVLNRYIPALTIMGGAFIGFLAAYADLTSAFGTGTGLLLTVMIVYQFYEQITAQHHDDIPPAIRKFLGE